MSKQLILIWSITLSVSLVTACKKDNLSPAERNNQFGEINISGIGGIGVKIPVKKVPKINATQREYFRKVPSQLRSLIKATKNILPIKLAKVQEKEKLLNQVKITHSTFSRNFNINKSNYEAQLKTAKLEKNTIQQERILRDYRQLLREKASMDNTYKTAEAEYDNDKKEYESEVQELEEYEVLIAEIEENEQEVGSLQ